MRLPSSLSIGPGPEDAVVLGVTAMLGAAAPSPREGPAPALSVDQQGPDRNR